MRIVVTEDMAMIRHEIVCWCQNHGHCVVAETTSATETVRLCRELRPDALLLDVRLPDGDGLSVVEIVRRETPAVKIVVLTAYTTPYFIDRLAQSAVDGFVDKSAETCAEIGEALAAVATGKKWFSPTFRCARQQQNRDPAFFGKLLTPREQTILGWIGHGLSNEEISLRLGMAARTVEDHRSNLLHKLHLDSTAKLIAFAIGNGFTAVLPLPQAS